MLIKVLGIMGILIMLICWQFIFKMNGFQLIVLTILCAYFTVYGYIAGIKETEGSKEEADEKNTMD